MNWFRKKHEHIWVYPTESHRLCACGVFEILETGPSWDGKKTISYWRDFHGTVEMWEISIKQAKEWQEASKQWRVVMDKEEEDRKKYATSFCQSNADETTKKESD